MSKRSPYVWRNVWINFINSLKPKKISGELKGEDRYGNKYYEIPADPSGGKRKPTRWFDPSSKDNFDVEKPAEWESWLRCRRTEPPNEEEIMKNFKIEQQKKVNAALLEEKAAHERIEMGRPEPSQDVKGMYSYPKYKEYDDK